MNEFLQVILSFPTVPFTVLLGIVICYWLFVTVGAVGIDVFEGAAEGAGKAAGEALEGAAKALGGDVDLPDADPSAAKGLVHDAASGSGVLAWLGLGKVPLTVSASAIAFWGWLFAALGTIHLAPALSSLPSLLAKLLVFGAALGASVLLSSLVLRPLHRLFVVREVERKTEVLGKVCTVTSGKVDAGFGTALFEDGAAGLLLKIACPKENAMKKGDRALIIDYDPATDTYEVEPIDWLLPEELEALKDPARAAAIAAARGRVR